AFASKNPPLPAVLDGLMMGAGFMVVLVLLGAMREALGQGTLFANMELLFGPVAHHWRITLVENYRGFLLAILPPGAFIGLGLIIAAKNVIDRRLKDAAKKRSEAEPKTS